MAERGNRECAPLNDPFEGIAHVDDTDDMYDSSKDLEGDSLLSRALYMLAVIGQPYWRANYLAEKMQEDHRRITKWALRTAVITVALAIVQLPVLAVAAEWFVVLLAVLEGGFAVTALWLVRKGVRQAVQKKWLLERHKAERYRFVKYRSILELTTMTRYDPALLEWEKRAELEIEEIKRMDVGAMEEWIKVNHRIAKDDASMQSVVSQEDFERIVEYYKRKRLERQIVYFGNRADTTFKHDELIRRLPPLFFLASLMIATIHLAFDFLELGSKLVSWLGKNNSWTHQGIHWIHQHVHGEFQVHWGTESAVFLIAAAALLPVAVAAVRTHRSANEYARNTVRFAAIRDELKDYLPVLEHPGPTRKLRTLWWCEEKLENEHLEWLRLMVEAEWYG